MKLHHLITEQTDTSSLMFDEKNIDDLPDKEQLKYWEHLAGELRQLRAVRFLRKEKVLKTAFQGTKYNYQVQAADRHNYVDFEHGYTVFSVPKNAQPSPQQVFDKVSAYHDAFQAEQDHLFELQLKAEKQAKAVKTKQRRALVAKVKQERPADDDVLIKQDPESSVPERLSTTGKGGFTNPYFAGESQRYAGDPEYYPFTDQMLVIYHQLKEILKKYGVAPFTKAYGSTHSLKNGSRTTFHRNFAIVGGNGKFIWRKYDPSPGAGQNWVIVGKHKYKTTDFLSPMYGQSRQDTLKEIK